MIQFCKCGGEVFIGREGAEEREGREDLPGGPGSNSCRCHFFIGHDIWHPAYLARS
jgi:hypothetical protein